MTDVNTEATTRRKRGTVLALALTVLALTVLALAGCGDGADDDEAQGREEPTEPASPGPTELPEPAEETTEVSLYFSNASLGDPCGEVFAVQREVVAEDPIGEALAALLAGPTAAEAAEGYTSWFSSDTAGMLQGYRSEGDTLHVDFADFSTVIPNASTSCGSGALLAGLDQTVGQFDGVERTRYSFDGSSEAFYEWLQRDVP